MTLQQLRFVFETVRQNFSLTQAAKTLGTSQSALSRGIIDLEAELGLAVFTRHGKRMQALTDAGKAICERAGRVLAEVDNIGKVSAEHKSRDAGELRIATTHTQARYTLPAVIGEFRKRYPAVRLTLMQGSPKQLMQMLLDRSVDFAIATEVPDDAPDLITIPALSWQHVVLVPKGHPLLSVPLPISLAQLARYPLITYVTEFAGRRRIDLAFERAGLSPDIVLAAIDSDVIKTYVRVGMGVGIIASLAYSEPADPDLAAIAAGELFGSNLVRLAMRRDSYLRGYAMAFAQLFAPDCDIKLLSGAQHTGTQEN